MYNFLTSLDNLSTKTYRGQKIGKHDLGRGVFWGDRIGAMFSTIGVWQGFARQMELSKVKIKSVIHPRSQMEFSWLSHFGGEATQLHILYYSSSCFFCLAPPKKHSHQGEISVQMDKAFLWNIIDILYLFQALQLMSQYNICCQVDKNRHNWTPMDTSGHKGSYMDRNTIDKNGQT